MDVLLTNSIGGKGIEAGIGCLREQGTVLDAVERSIRVVESDSCIHSVGRGGWPNVLGDVELDASIMDGDSLNSGAVGALKGYPHPITVARRVMLVLPHVLLVGEGAARFAAEEGMETGDNLTPEARKGWRMWLEEPLCAEDLTRWPHLPLAPLVQLSRDPIESTGTTIVLARDSAAKLAAGVSTSGWAWKYPGRLGDSPIIGAGNFVDSRYGAAACTGHGELTIRAATARTVVLLLKMGMGLAKACREAADELCAMQKDFRYCVTIYALDREGNHHVLSCGSCSQEMYWLWTDAMQHPVQRRAEHYG